MAVWNLHKTMKQGSFINNEADEALPLRLQATHVGKRHWHSWIERRPVQMVVFSLVAVGIGGIVELVPTFLIKSNVPTIASVKPYTPLELQGRDLYVREGCYTCHSQMIRPFRDEEARYGEYSKAGEFIYDHPFQWGSKRTGPDLAREGGKYPDSWHYRHFRDPQEMSVGSIMPSYEFLLKAPLQTSTTARKIRAMQTLGVPYPKGYDEIANTELRKQAAEITKSLKTDKINADPNSEVIALIAYLQRMGTDIKKSETTQNEIH